MAKKGFNCSATWGREERVTEDTEPDFKKASSEKKRNRQVPKRETSLQRGGRHNLPTAVMLYWDREPEREAFSSLTEFPALSSTPVEQSNLIEA